MPSSARICWSSPDIVTDEDVQVWWTNSRASRGIARGVWLCVRAAHADRPSNGDRKVNYIYIDRGSYLRHSSVLLYIGSTRMHCCGETQPRPSFQKLLEKVTEMAGWGGDLLASLTAIYHSPGL